jgi:hypothetical protein
VTTITRTKSGLLIAGIAFVVAGTTAIRLAAAQEPEQAVAVDVSECVKLTTPEERLACFESQVEEARNAPRPAPPPATSGAASANSSSGEFGQNRDPEPVVQEIEARVTGLRETVPNAYLITLDNGQVWRQTVPKSYGLREGHPVRIYYSKWRAYRLTNEQSRGFIQVERVR